MPADLRLRSPVSRGSTGANAVNCAAVNDRAGVRPEDRVAVEAPADLLAVLSVGCSRRPRVIGKIPALSDPERGVREAHRDDVVVLHTTGLHRTSVVSSQPQSDPRRME
jgi:hypothetical protein